ncbi:MAG: hypothetical protein QW597_04670 [Thermoplasmataceae archaeon]
MDDTSVYTQGWLDNAKTDGDEFGKENLDRIINNAREKESQTHK